MSHCKVRARALLAYAVPTLVVFLLSGGLAESAGAAAPAPESTTHCGGTLKRVQPTTNDPNLLNYNFACDTPISAYTLIANRGQNDGAVLDDFLAAPTAVDPTGVAVSVALSCSGEIPGNGINCNAGAGGLLPAPDTVTGSIDTTDPYCANIPAGSKPGTKPEPSAIVDLVVTNISGAEDGPFRLRLRGKCPKVHVTKANGKTRAAAKGAGRGRASSGNQK